ncbi:MAG: DUF1566 domain-containing protein [Deltaproteobacteria bacterium]|nr:DUF1566 domain-containing protein [Deltaproteobacteria bacterium]
MYKKIAFLILLFAFIISGSVFAAQPGWETMSSGTTANLNSIYGFGGNDIYAVGASGLILHFDGSSWSTQPSGTTWNLNDVYGPSAGNVYAVGDYRGIFRNTGSGWSKANSQSLNYPLYAIGGPDPSNGKINAFGKNNTIWVFFVPQYYNIVNGTDSSFSSQEQHEHSNDLYGSWTLPNGDQVVTGSKGILGYMVKDDFWGHRNIDTWKSPVSSTLRGIWGIDADNLFAVGDGGIILRRQNGGNWAKMTSPTTQNLRSVWGTDMNNVYAVGAAGTLLKFNGTSWSTITVPTTQQLNKIWGASANEIYMVANGGIIIRYAGSQSCYCPNGTTSTQLAKADGSGWEQCQCTNYSFWCDPDTNICWQDPQKDAYPISGEGADLGIASQDAPRYCDGLQIAGYDDWRVPTIAELRSLVRGNPDTMPSGDCPLTDGSSFEEGQDAACLGAPDAGGPGIEGCYWPAELTGSCHRPDIGTQNVHSLEFWALEAASNRPDWIASILFDIGGVCYNHINSYADVRCIRNGPATPVSCDEAENCTPGETRQCNRAQIGDDPKTAIGSQTCNAAGTCWGPCDFGGFTPTPRPSDVCDQCDQLTLTIRVPEQLTAQPAQLMAFFYEAASWTFPPQGPPDGGTDYNLVQNPDINADNPYTMVLPGCTYYRESCLAGNYQLYVGLYYSTDWPPLPADGDYVWGKDQPAITLGGGPQQNLSMDITLDKCENGECNLAACPNPALPVQCPNNECVADASQCCPVDKPARCSDGTCAASADQCPTCGDNQPLPNDDTVWGCRFENDYSDTSCADFAECDGWPNDQAAIEAACLATGNGAANCVCTRGESCQVSNGMTSDATRCTFTQSSKNWYAYGMPSIGCSFGGGSGFANGPFCTPLCP